MRTESLLPGVVYHFCHNALSASLSYARESWPSFSQLTYHPQGDPEGLAYHGSVLAVAALLACVILGIITWGTRTSPAAGPKLTEG
jgi:hypothetical protein